MIALNVIVAAAVVAFAPGEPAKHVHHWATGAELAECQKAVDQPICLLRISSQSNLHKAFSGNIAIGYAPDVLAAIGPDPAEINPSLFQGLLAAPSKAAVQALIADRAGATPSAALAPIRALPVATARDPADQPKMAKFAAFDRIHAYQMLWRAARGDDALPVGHRPSDALVLAALAAWRSDLPAAEDDGSPEDLAEAYRAFGDNATADVISPMSSSDRLAAQLDAGRYREAVETLEQIRTEPSPAYLASGQIGDRAANAMVRSFYFADLGRVEERAAAGGSADIAIGLAKKALGQWLDGPAKNPEVASHVTFGEDVMVAPQLLLIVAKSPRPDALKWVERMDSAARNRALPTAPISALAAMRGWFALGQPARGAELARLWDPDIRAAAAVCKSGGLKACGQHPAILIAMGLKTQPLGTPWDELMPLSDHRPGAAKLIAGGKSAIDARVAEGQDPWERMGPLFECMSTGAEAKDMSLATYCAHRLADEAPAPARAVLPGAPAARPERVGAILRLAVRAAEQHDAKTMHEMVDLAMQLSARDGEEEFEAGPALETIAIAELREQGRL